MKTLCVIPARAGSKRLPDKAILPFAGTTLLEITCKQANRVFDNIVVSSDSIDYLERAEECFIPYFRHRPHKLATDTTPMVAVVKDAVDWVEVELGVRYDTVVLLQVTSPLRTDEDIRGALKEFDNNTLFSVNKVKFPVNVEEPYQKNGAVYIYPAHPTSAAFYSMYEMPIERSIDIDTQHDFDIAEFLFKKQTRELERESENLYWGRDEKSDYTYIG